jgi:ribonuclease R
LVGIIISAENNYYLAFIPLLGKNKPAEVFSPEKLQIGERVLVHVSDWKKASEPLKAQLKEKLGHIDNAAADIKTAIAEFNLANDFSQEALQEAGAFKEETIQNALEGREDYSRLNTITIDPATAKDFDDALSLSKDAKGHFHLGVHIADVAYFVRPSSPLDLEAVKRSNSTYFPGFCLPMLPKTLSDNLCSLKPDLVRLTVSVMMEFDPQGQLIDYQIKRSFIRNKRRFSYEEAMQVIDKKTASPFQEELQQMAELCQLLKKERSQRGSIDFSLPSSELIVDENGEPTAIKIVTYDLSHQLVEEFMLKANELVADNLSRRQKKLIYRVHEAPDAEAAEDFFDLARSLHFTLPPNPTQEEIQKLFLKAKDSPFAGRLAIGFIRSMKLALYSQDNLGHYGLALEHYCHFTSPIRRYSDLIAVRLLFDEEGKIDLEAIAEKCSFSERKSFKAEMAVLNLKKLRLLKRFHLENSKRLYPAIITKIKPYFLFFELKELAFEGSLHLSELNDDFYLYHLDELKLVGQHTRRSFQAGDEIGLMIQKVDLSFLEAQWKIQPPPKPASI